MSDRPIEKLVKFIENASDDYRYVKDWEDELTTKVPEWKKVVKLKKNWPIIENARPKHEKPRHDYDDLCRAILNVVGIELAEKWFRSDVEAQKRAAEGWFEDNLSYYRAFNPEVREYLIENASWRVIDHLDGGDWNRLTRQLKNLLIEKIFERDRDMAEPFRSIEEMRNENRMIFHEWRHLYDKIAKRGYRPEWLPMRSLQNVIVADYIPSVHVERLRHLVEDANDTKFLRRIDRLIAERKKDCCHILPIFGCNGGEQPYHLSDLDREMVARLFDITRENGFQLAPLPVIELSFDPPPLFLAYPELEWEVNEHSPYPDEEIPKKERRRPEYYPIEEMLGLYSPYKEKIVLFARGIEWFTLKRGIDSKWLYAVVLIHELGHWVTHSLPKEGTPFWEADLFARSDRDVLEGWAQLITYWIAEEVGGKFKQTFEDLNKTQSPPYHAYKKFIKEPIDQMLLSLEKMRMLKHPATMESWEKILKLFRLKDI